MAKHAHKLEVSVLDEREKKKKVLCWIKRAWFFIYAGVTHVGGYKRNAWCDLICLLQTSIWAPTTNRQLADSFKDIRRNQLRQWLGEGCRKPVLGVWHAALTHVVGWDLYACHKTDTGTDTGQAWKGGKNGIILNPTVIKCKGKHCNRDFPSSLQVSGGRAGWDFAWGTFECSRLPTIHAASAYGQLFMPVAKPSMQLPPKAN